MSYSSYLVIISFYWVKAEARRIMFYFTESEEDQVYNGPKTVTWAPENEERIIENREQLSELRSKTSKSRFRRGRVLTFTSFYLFRPIWHGFMVDL